MTAHKVPSPTKKLLQQLRALHAPDRCETPFNFVYNGVGRMVYNQTGTLQDRITQQWNDAEEIQRKKALKTLARTAVYSLYELCIKINNTGLEKAENTVRQQIESQKTKPILQIQLMCKILDEFFDSCTSENLNQIFSTMIVVLRWRELMQEAWHMQ